MSDVEHASELFQKSLLTTYDTVGEIWEDEYGTNVTTSSGITNINFTRFTNALPSYYSGQFENGVYTEISASSDIWTAITKILGQGTKSGFEVFFDDVANVNFTQVAQSGATVGAITFGGYDSADPSSEHHSTGYNHALAVDNLTQYKLEGDIFLDFNPAEDSGLGNVSVRE